MYYTTEQITNNHAKYSTVKHQDVRGGGGGARRNGVIPVEMVYTEDDTNISGIVHGSASDKKMALNYEGLTMTRISR